MFQPNGISLHVEDHGRQAGGLATRMLAFVALRGGCVTNEDELREHARRRLADLKLPDKIVFLEKLPERYKRQDTAHGTERIRDSGGVKRRRNSRLALRGSCEP